MPSELCREAVAGIDARAATESLLQRGVLANQSNRPRPRRDRVQALGETRSDEGTNRIAPPACPAEPLKLPDQLGDLRGIKEGGDRPCEPAAADWYRLAYQVS